MGYPLPSFGEVSIHAKKTKQVSTNEKNSKKEFDSVEKKASRKHFEALVEKREPWEHFSASAYGLGFEKLSLGSLFSTLASKTFYSLPFFQPR